MKLKLTIGIPLLFIGFVLGQQMTMAVYDPKVLEDLVLQHTRSTYALGCSEGIQLMTGKKETFLLCLDLAEKTVKEQEEIFRNKIWNK